MRLKRSNPARRGLRRVRRGTGFSYVDQDGRPVPADVRERIRALAIPPAWTDVWISPDERGHIQAVGTDDAGRRQYLYHPQWAVQRSRVKHDRVCELARALPAFRRTVAADLAKPGLGRERVLALALRLLDSGQFRPGWPGYEEENGSYGVATLLARHVDVSRNTVTFCFPAKSGQQQEATVTDPLTARAVRALLRSAHPRDHLLRYRDRAGWHDLTAEDVHDRFRELVGDGYTVKDLRTWTATVTAAIALAAQPDPSTRRERAAAERAALTETAEWLGNTPAVARRSYVDPRLFDEYAVGRTAGPPDASPGRLDDRAWRRAELSVLRLLESG
jgi:DNA topoisomerase-1